jgi:lipopolysaccharide/colanic/teichoic acid biosynthesis glycosyltransferase
MLPQALFLRMLSLERKRAERSSRGFVLMLLETNNLLKDHDKQALDRVLTDLAMSIRETDIKGWYKADAVVGVIFTDIAAADGIAIANALLEKVTIVLGKSLRIEQIKEIRLSFHVFPESSNQEGAGTRLDPVLYPELLEEQGNGAIFRLAKRSMDIAGSLLALAVSSPLLVAIAAAIKLTSSGPILFRQQRVGQGGRRFTFLKFRSMYATNDHSIHKEYVTQLITGVASAQPIGSAKRAVYKLTNDPRVTPLGRFLRRSSLDELPQLVNVLQGEMSLVGPRPPVPYEFECYKTWHRRRLLAVKPGITGIWQVEGRSTVKFDGMVRLDLKYARSWSPWLDLQILWRTPKAIVLGSGAY